MRKLILLVSLFLLVVVPALAQDTFALTILHTNDTHSWHEPNANGDGGVARQATVVNQIRAEGGNVILLDAGDRFTGTLFHQQYRGQDQVEIMNALGYDAMTLGNHEFDDGEEVLYNFVSQLDFPVVSTNIDWGSFAELDELVQPYVTLDVAGVQIGVIGLTTSDTPTSSSPADEIVFSDDLVGSVESAVGELTAAGVNKIILLTHVGVEVDMAILTELVGVDVVIGGHSHTLFSTAYRASGDNTYPYATETSAGERIVYVSAGSNNTYLGRLNVQFDENGVVSGTSGDTILLSRYIVPDPAMDEIVTRLGGTIEELRATPIGADASVYLVGDRRVCRVEECLLGNLITDAMRAETGAQLAITNGGGIRADIDEGEITLGEVLTVLPFGNLTATFELTGADVVAALENGVSGIRVDGGNVVRDGAGGRFPQVSGLRYSFDPNLEAGSRIVSVEVQNEAGEWVAIDPAATYTVASNDFMRQGGDGYSVFQNNAMNAYDFGKPLDQVLAEYLAANTPVAPTIEGRITIVNATLPPA